MIIDKLPSGYPGAYLGDGVYGEWDGYHVWLRVDDKYSPRVVALEPKVMDNLNSFYNIMARRAVINTAKKIAFEILNQGRVMDAYNQFIIDMQRTDKLHDGDRIELISFVADLTNGKILEEEEVGDWINSFN